MKYRDAKENEYIKFSTARDYLHTACSGMGSNGGLMLKIRFEEEETVEHNEWIPCSERLPEEGNTTYMTTLDYGELGRVTGQRFFYGKHIGWEDDAVIAWMPLPEPYKEQNESI